MILPIFAKNEKNSEMKMINNILSHKMYITELQLNSVGMTEWHS